MRVCLIPRWYWLLFVEVTQATDSTPTEEMDESEKSASDETQHTELNELPHEPIKSSDATHTVESPSSDETSR